MTTKPARVTVYDYYETSKYRDSFFFNSIIMNDTHVKTQQSSKT